MSDNSIRSTVASLAQKIGGEQLADIVFSHFGKIGVSVLVVIAVIVGYLLGFEISDIMTWLNLATT